MPDLYYTAVIKDNAVLMQDGITYAEHFESATERDKRAKQFYSMIIGDESKKVYSGTMPPEAFIVLITTPTTEAETVVDGDSKETIEAKLKAFNDRKETLAAKAGAKTVSKLTSPEVDDSSEARGLPDWAKAQHEVEAATQALIEAKADVEAKKIRFDAVFDEVFGTDPNRPDPRKTVAKISDGIEKDLVRQSIDPTAYVPTPLPNHLKVISAQGDLDRAEGNLYKAENDLAAKVAKYEEIKPKEGKNA